MRKADYLGISHHKPIYRSQSPIIQAEALLKSHESDVVRNNIGRLLNEYHDKVMQGGNIAANPEYLKLQSFLSLLHRAHCNDLEDFPA